MWVTSRMKSSAWFVCQFTGSDRKAFFVLSMAPSLFSSRVGCWCVTPREDQGLHGLASVRVCIVNGVVDRKQAMACGITYHLWNLGGWWLEEEWDAD